MAAEDEAVQMAIRTGEAVAGSAEKLISLLFQIIEAARRSRGETSSGDGVLMKAAKGGSDLVDRHLLNGHGNLGDASRRAVFEDAEAHGDGIKAIPVLEYNGAGGKLPDDVKLLRDELKKYGVKFNILTRACGDGKSEAVVTIGARNLSLLQESLRAVGLKSFDMDASAFQVPAEKAGAADTAETVDTAEAAPGYPDEFLCGRYTLTKSEADENTWTSVCPDDERVKLTFALDPETGRVRYDAKRNGETLCRGLAEPVSEADWVRDEAGEPILGDDGLPRIFCRRLGDGSESSYPAVPGAEIPCAVMAADYRLSCAGRGQDEREAVERDVKGMREVLGKDSAGADAAPSPTENFGKAQAAAKRPERPSSAPKVPTQGDGRRR